MNDNIWLVVWDLDQTLFSTEAGNGDLADYTDIIKTLVGRGIMNSCCSRGSFQAARGRLEELGIWDYLVFPCINTYSLSKAERVDQIIKNTRLRPHYTLYLDNNTFNRKLAEAALPKLNTAPLSDIFSLTRQPEMKGFIDKMHIRLAQYKLVKPLSESKMSSEFSFMAHAVMECSMIGCESLTPDIQRVFADSPALNYTGSRLGADEITVLLNDPEVKNVCITLRDIFKDHGVVGFCSTQANKLLHFAFRSELADIPGVEQWAYAKLGYPIFTKSRYCIGEVDSSGAPDWINQYSDISDAMKSKTRPQLLLRGGEELKGITQHIEKHVSVTAELFNEPTSVCYAVKGQLYTEEEKKFILQYIPFLDPGVFSTGMFTGAYDHVLVSVLTERSMIKYSHKANPTLAAYLPKEHADRLAPEFFDQFQSYVYSDDELDDSLQYICDNLPRQTSLIIMTAPEVEFARVSESDGSDPDRYAADYQRRVRYNAIAEEIVVRNTNAYLLDIRALVKSEADLYDFHVLHYNPQIDYELSRVLTALMGVKMPEPNRRAYASPLTEAKLVPEAGPALLYRAFIVNGLFVVQVEQPERTGLTFSFTVMMGSQAVDQTDFSADSMHETRINAFGVYWARVGVKQKGAEYYFETSYFVYSAKTVFNYLDKTAPNFANIHRSHLLPLFDAADNSKQLDHDLNTEIRALLAEGCSVFDYFKRQGIEEISILADAATAPLIMDSAGASKIKIKHMFTLDMPFCLEASLRTRQYRFTALKAEALNENDTLFTACTPGKQEIADIIKRIPNKVKIVWLHSALHTLSTDRFFTACIRDAVKRGGGGSIIVLRLPTIRGLKNPSQGDRALLPYNTAKLLTAAETDISSLPDVFKGAAADKLLQTAILPPTVLGADGIWRFSDRESGYMNISGGLRHTVNQPDKYAGTVYIFGGSMVFGKLVSDNETIASKLQASVNLPLRVVNCANFDGRMQASRMLSLLESIKFYPNDIIVIAMEEDQTASTIIPFQFRYVDNTFIKADALSVLNGVSGAYYLNNVYSPKGSELVADLLRDKIYGLVRLFD